MKFQTLFGLQSAYILFGASESLSQSLQSKDLPLQEALSAVNLAKSLSLKDKEMTKLLRVAMIKLIVQLKNYK